MANRHSTNGYAAIEEIKVHVLNMGRKSLYMRYRDPMTGKQHTRSTGTSKRRDALKAAGQWEAELREGRYASPSKTTWSDFRERYSTQYLMHKKPKTDAKAQTIFDYVEHILKPERLRDLTAERLSLLQSKLLEGAGPKPPSKPTWFTCKPGCVGRSKWGCSPRCRTLPSPTFANRT